MKHATRKYCSHCNAAFASNIDKCPRDGADLHSQDINPLLGQVFGKRYMIVERLGVGGMGEVYRAEHVTIGKSFAIKVLLGEVGADNNMVARFHREAKSLSLLSHRNIVGVADFGETAEGLLYLATEFVDGTDLASEMKHGVFDLSRIVHVVRQIAKALAHAHKRGLVHRDLKPENVMLVQTDDEVDVVKVLDFGIARVTEGEDDLEDENSETRNRLTSQGIVMGTPAYIAPEQAMGAPLDHRADLYSLGILLYELLTGDVPFRAKSPIELMSMHLQLAPPDIERSDVSSECKAVVRRLLAKKPQDRYEDVDAFLDAFDKLPESAAAGSYSRSTKNLRVTPESKRLAIRQGSDTLLAPAVTPANQVAVGGPDLTSETEGVSAQGKGMLRILAVLAVICALGIAASLTMRGDNDDSAEPIVENAAGAGGAEAVIVATNSGSDAGAKVLSDAAVVDSPPPSQPDAAMPRAPVATPVSKPVKRRPPPPTMQAMQSSVERIGTRLNTMSGSLDKEDFARLRRKWLDLATALPDLDSSVESRRKFASRVNRLNNQIKKASRGK